MVQLKAVISACEAFYAGVFCGGNVAQARGLMLPQKTDERVDLAQFQVSAVVVRADAALVLFVHVLYTINILIIPGMMPIWTEMCPLDCSYLFYTQTVTTFPFRVGVVHFFFRANQVASYTAA